MYNEKTFYSIRVQVFSAHKDIPFCYESNTPWRGRWLPVGRRDQRREIHRPYGWDGGRNIVYVGSDCVKVLRGDVFDNGSDNSWTPSLDGQ